MLGNVDEVALTREASYEGMTGVGGASVSAKVFDDNRQAIERILEQELSTARFE